MICKEITYSLPDFVSGRLAADEQLLVAQHLTLCQSCRRDVEELSALLGRLSSHQPKPPVHAYWNSLLPRIHEQLDARNRAALVPEWVRFVLPASVAVMVAIFALNLQPLDTVTDEQEVHAIVHDLPTAEIGRLAQREEVANAYEMPEFSNELSLLQSPDKDILKVLAAAGEDIDYYSELDSDVRVISVADEDADEVITKLKNTKTIN